MGPEKKRNRRKKEEVEEEGRKYEEEKKEEVKNEKLNLRKKGTKGKRQVKTGIKNRYK